MTIVSGPDHRNAGWANDSSTFGQKMLLKMGWSKGKGLGKNEQGTNDNLRAIRREEGLGIGAKTDLHGSEGFNTTSRNFHGVLATLQQEHANDSSSSKSSSKKSKKKRKKSSKVEKSSKDSGSLTLSSKRVTAGHSAKMRDSKDLSKKSKEDMAAIFGMKVDDYAQNSVWGRLSTLSSSNDTSDAGKEKKMEPKSESKMNIEKKRKKKDKRKRKRSSEGKESTDDDEVVKEKKKKKKSKK
eukprot:CAMPEP_0194098974 /NCGR_PEP_ID=MMETSP0150-20130528/277_1 /TAXON_ID=122233 /ORGANISM="Chaetoceros debilis, Strain MM31A-1" /LENGTH=239 /DNA_ID=CAMNT_0038785097 /DNA_START=82 /DNA_END=798 /DNA_ORIENTATION=+